MFMESHIARETILAFWGPLSLEERRRVLAGTHAAIRPRLPLLAYQGGAANARRFRSLPPEAQTMQLAAMTFGSLRAAARRRGEVEPICYIKLADGSLVLWDDYKSNTKR
jgi:hypothetical protein